MPHIFIDLQLETNARVPLFLYLFPVTPEDGPLRVIPDEGVGSIRECLYLCGQKPSFMGRVVGVFP